ncbi:hypothetical protein [Hymenobacter actinosclerus]|nr:hypothetical protein [Hymenobacter actinosclerus]
MALVLHLGPQPASAVALAVVGKASRTATCQAGSLADVGSEEVGRCQR